MEGLVYVIGLGLGLATSLLGVSKCYRTSFFKGVLRMGKCYCVCARC